MSEKESLSKIINNSKPDIIIHLAAVSHVTNLIKIHILRLIIALEL